MVVRTSSRRARRSPCPEVSRDATRLPSSPAESPDATRPAPARMEECARAEDRAGLVTNAYAFHASIVALAGHRRLNESYAAVQQQQILCMARNLYVREHDYEDLVTHVARHRHLLDVIEAGDPAAVLAEIAV